MSINPACGKRASEIPDKSKISGGDLPTISKPTHRMLFNESTTEGNISISEACQMNSNPTSYGMPVQSKKSTNTMNNPTHRMFNENTTEGSISISDAYQMNDDPTSYGIPDQSKKSTNVMNNPIHRMFGENTTEGSISISEAYQMNGNPTSLLPDQSKNSTNGDLPTSNPAHSVLNVQNVSDSAKIDESLKSVTEESFHFDYI